VAGQLPARALEAHSLFQRLDRVDRRGDDRAVRDGVAACSRRRSAVGRGHGEGPDFGREPGVHVLIVRDVIEGQNAGLRRIVVHAGLRHAVE